MEVNMDTANEPTMMGGIALGRDEVKKQYTESDFAHIDRDELIFQLWKIIDNIDTFGDMAKSNDKAFRSLTEKEQRKRWDFASQDLVDFLYDKYYDRCHKNGSPHGHQID